MLREMIELLREARHAHCRIKTWKFTEYQASWLALEIAPMWPHKGLLEIMEGLRRGDISILGCQVVVRE